MITKKEIENIVEAVSTEGLDFAMEEGFLDELEESAQGKKVEEYRISKQRLMFLIKELARENDINVDSL